MGTEECRRGRKRAKGSGRGQKRVKKDRRGLKESKRGSKRAEGGR